MYHHHTGVAPTRLRNIGRTLCKGNVGGAGERPRANAIHLPMRVTLHQLAAEHIDQFRNRHAFLPGVLPLTAHIKK